MESDTTNDLVYFAFDAMFAEEQDIRSQSLFERKAKLRKLLDDAGGPPSIRYVTHLDMDGKDVIKAACEMKLEGIVSKRVSAPYVSGRKGNWTKSKSLKGLLSAPVVRLPWSKQCLTTNPELKKHKA